MKHASRRHSPVASRFVWSRSTRDRAYAEVIEVFCVPQNCAISGAYGGYGSTRRVCLEHCSYRLLVLRVGGGDCKAECRVAPCRTGVHDRGRREDKNGGALGVTRNEAGHQPATAPCDGC